MKIENYGRLVKRRYKTIMTITTAAIIALLLNSCFSAGEPAEKTGSAVENFVIDSPTSSEDGGKVLGIVSEKKLTAEKVPSEVSAAEKKTTISTDETLSMGSGLTSSQNFVSEDMGGVVVAAGEAGGDRSVVISENGTGSIDKDDIKSMEDKYNLLVFGNHNIYREDHRTGSGMGSPIKSSVQPIKIWDLGKSITGTTYNLKADEISKDVDGLRTMGAEIINEATITLESTSLVRTTESNAGMKIQAGGVGVNKGTIKGDGIGMSVTDGVADNKGRIETTGDYGMYAGSGGTAINNVDARIFNTGNYGMYIEDGATGVNKVMGYILNGGNYGVYVTNGGAFINEGVIGNTGNYGMYASNDGIVINKADIGYSNRLKNYGMAADGSGSTAINEQVVSVSENYGMAALNGGLILNRAEITNKNDYGMSADGNGSTAFNRGNISNKGNYGMSAVSGGQVLNEVGGTVENTNDYGISASGGGSTALNRGTVSNGGNYGMSASFGGQVLNEAMVSNDGEKGMSADNGGIIINKGTVSNKGINGMYASGVGSTALNRGTVSNTGEYGMASLSGGKILNEGTISNDGNYGMYAGNVGSTANNRGTISNKGSNGMIAIHGGTVLNEATVSNEGTQGMYAEGSGSIATNRGVVSNTSDYGMYSTNEGQIINEGSVSNSGRFGMHAISNSTATNKGVISNKGDYGLYARIGSTAVNEAEGTISNTGNVRMHAENSNTNGEAGSTAINKGILETGFNNYTVMSARGNKSEIINEGTIAVDHDNSIGMYVSDGADAINTGEIYLNASNGTAIKAADATSTITNSGKIILSGTLTGTEDDKNNKAFDLNGATLINTGTVVSDGTVNLKAVDGKFVFGTGGTIESDKIEGDFYAGSALVLGGYEEKYTSYEALKTKNIEGNVFSDSAMFNSKIVKNGENYDIVLERKNFKSIINNSDLGEVLENSYSDNGNPLKENYYNALKSISDVEGLNEGIEDSYGMEYYPTIAKQTLDILNNSNRVITNNVIKDRRTVKIGDITAIAGGDFTKLKEDSYESVSGYDLELYSVYLGAEKQIKEKTRVGGILTIGKASASYKDIDASRDDYYYQGNIYIVHENEDKLKFTSMIFAGITDTDLERDLSVTTINETLTDNVDNYYVGIKNSLSKRWDIGKNYIEPKVELNITHMMQGDISEKGDYAIDIDSVDSTSIETGVGVAIGRDIFLAGGSKINLEVSLTGYAELGNPYEDLNSTFKVLSDEKVKISGYEGNDYYGDAVIRGSYATPQLLTVYTEAGYRAGDTSDNWLGSVGIKFLF